MEKPTHTYVGRKSCGCVMGLVVDEGDKRTGEAVADFIASGLKIERVDWTTYTEKIRHEETFFDCPHGQIAMSL